MFSPEKRALAAAAAAAPEVRVVLIQRLWRGVRARRAFSELFFEFASGELQLQLPGILADASATSPQTPSRRRSSSVTLEEALIEAGRQCRTPQATSAVSPSFAVERGNGHRRASSACAVMLPRRCQLDGASTPVNARSPAAPSAVHGAAAADIHVPEPTVDEDSVAGMSIDALHELVGVLTRIIATRNGELVGLLERRDELEHEREYRENMVAQLVSQVDKSRSVKSKGGSKPAHSRNPSWGRTKGAGLFGRKKR